MKTIFSPSCLFISESQWQDEEKMDSFLEHLFDHLSNISNYEITKIYWTDELEELLWNYPQLPPWRQDKDWNNSIVPTIYKLLNNKQEFLQNENNLSTCFVQPDFQSEFLSDVIHNYFLELMHILIDKNENVYLCLGIDQIQQEYTFFCNCHSCEIKPIVIEKPIKWLEYVDFVNIYWPKKADEKDRFDKCLEVIFKIGNVEPIHNYDFSNNFLKDIIDATNHRKEIIQSIAKRLTISKQQAAKDQALQEEYITKKQEYRFRVTQRPFSTRIHYKYTNHKIIFLKYYGEGEHDDGL